MTSHSPIHTYINVYCVLCECLISRYLLLCVHVTFCSIPAFRYIYLRSRTTAAVVASEEVPIVAQ